MIADGIYRIYKLRHDEAEQTHRRLAARLHFSNGQVVHLENHHGMDDLIPEGPVTPQIERRFNQLRRSGYHEVIHEEHIAAGHHETEVDPLDVGNIAPDHKFIMTGAGLTNPAIVELWHDAMTLDGRDVDETEAHQIMGEVAAGRLVLTPID